MYRRYYRYEDSLFQKPPHLRQNEDSAAKKCADIPKGAPFKNSDDLLLIGLIAIILFSGENPDIYLVLALCYILAS